VCSSLALLTGPNMAGKSTYLRQVALIVVLAQVHGHASLAHLPGISASAVRLLWRGPGPGRCLQVGCFVPAEFAALSPVDRLFTRIGMSDSIETNSSTFMVEMTVRARASSLP